MHQLIAYDRQFYYFILEDEPENSRLMKLSRAGQDLELFVYGRTGFEEVTILYHPALLRLWNGSFLEKIQIRERSSGFPDLSVLDEAQ